MLSACAATFSHVRHVAPIFAECEIGGSALTALRAAVWSMIEEHTTRPGRARPKHHFSRKTCSWCFEGSWERKSEPLSGQMLRSCFFRPSKFAVARYGPTSPQCPAYLLRTFLSALALLYPMLAIKAKRSLQQGRRMPTERSASSVIPASLVSRLQRWHAAKPLWTLPNSETSPTCEIPRIRSSGP